MRLENRYSDWICSFDGGEHDVVVAVVVVDDDVVVDGDYVDYYVIVRCDDHLIDSSRMNLNYDCSHLDWTYLD